MKSSKLGTLVLTTLLIAGCGINLQQQNTDKQATVNKITDKVSASAIKLSKADIARLDKEYLSFKTKSLSAEYFQKKLVMLVSTDNGVANGTNIVQDLEYARYKTETVIPFQAMVTADPAFYTILSGVTAIGTQRTGSGPFDQFFGNAGPVSSPTATAATTITTTGFTANWNSSASATSGYVLTVKQGTTVVSTISIPSQTTLSQAVTGLTSFTAYTYTVKAKNGTLLSAGSSPISVSTASTVVPNTGTVSTIAGNGSPGFVNANGTNALFSFPTGIAVDSSGNLFIADSNNNKIRKITSTADVTTFAGSFGGYSDGNGINASFNFPTGLTIDSSGILFTIEPNSNKLRKITTAADVTTVGTNAIFNGPQGVAVDPSGNLYVSDTNNNKIIKVTPGGVVSTFAGGGTGGSVDANGINATFSTPYGLAVDSTTGNVFVADLGNNKIRKITPAGDVTTLAGTGTGGSDGNGTNARFNGPIGLAVDITGNVYVADQSNNKIRKITPAGDVTTLAGDPSGGAGYVDGVGTVARFNNPRGVAVDSTGKIYVAEYQGNRIRKIQ